MNPEEKEIKKPIKSLRTYQGDVEEALGKTKSSAATIMIAEQKRKEKSPEIFDRPKNLEVRNKTFIVTGISLLLLGLIVVGSVYYVRSNEKTALNNQTESLVAYSVEQEIPLTSLNREKLIDKILSEKQAFKLPPNSVLYLNTVDDTSTTVPVSSVLSLIAPKIPSSLARAFEGKYMLGVYSFDTNEPFIILTTNDFPAAYSGMLKWEKDMVADLGKIFSIVVNNSEPPLLFIDETIKNKDLRALVDSKQKTILLYSFIDKNTVVITTNESIFNALNGKYLINQQTR